MIRITGLSIPVKNRSEKEELSLLRTKVQALQKPRKPEDFTLEILSKSIDARKKPDLRFVYTLAVKGLSFSAEKALLKKKTAAKISQYELPAYQVPATPSVTGTDATRRPIVVGAGPAGLFCAYALALSGLNPIVIERGKRIEDRVTDVERFWKGGTLNPSSNVQFGEGGAGTFSDGKLNSQIGDKEGRIRFILQTFHQHGAPASILTDAKPHIGTDRLRKVLMSFREEILKLGGEFLFETCLTDISAEENGINGVHLNHDTFLPADTLVLAIGHSARDTFRNLYASGVPMEGKDFAVGLRITHPQEYIDRAQYGLSPEAMASLGLKSAPYKLTHRTAEDRGVYSFCMCPGGYIVNASSESGRLCVNGMSDYGRDSGRANSGIVTSLRISDLDSDHPLAGLEFQQQIEERAYALRDGKIPVESVRAFCGFMQNKTPGISSETPGDGIFDTLCLKGESAFAPVHTLYPAYINQALYEGMLAFDHKIPGFLHDDAFFAGVETRTSSPVRIPRDTSCQSAIRGLYPCGEGAGYAGGIISAAVDGLRVAEKIISGKPSL